MRVVQDTTKRVALTKKQYISELFARLSEVQREYPKEVMDQFLTEYILYRLDNTSPTPVFDEIVADLNLTRAQAANYILNANLATGQDMAAAVRQYNNDLKGVFNGS